MVGVCPAFEVPKMSDELVCPYCRVAFDADDFPPCEDATKASSCTNNRRPKFKPQIVGPDFKRIEDDPVRLSAPSNS